MKDMKKLDKVADKIVIKRNRKRINQTKIEKLINNILRRLIYEYDDCVKWDRGYEYKAVQQFRPVMEKIVDIINLVKYGQEYLDYLEYLAEYQAIKDKWDFIKGEIPDKDHCSREKFFKEHQLGKVIKGEHIYTNKFFKFDYNFYNGSKDSSLILHNQVSTYRIKIGDNIVKDIQNIVLFFVTKILIELYPLKKLKRKRFLEDINKKSQDKMVVSKLIRKKQMKELKNVFKMKEELIQL